MKFFKKNKNITFLIAFILFIAIFVSGLTPVLGQDSTYQISVAKGTSTLIVTDYNEDDWEDEIEDESDPDDFFDGDSDTQGARNKLTIRGISEFKWDSFDVLTLLFDVFGHLPSYAIPIILQNYTEDDIEELYPDEYKVWEILASKWDFESEGFDEEPDESEFLIPVFKNPKYFKEILEVYNTWAVSLNSTLIALGIDPYPILDGDDLIWMLIQKDMLIIASPFNAYLEDIVDKLDCEDVEAQGDSLIIERKGEKKYTVEISFNNEGVRSDIKIINSEDKVVYEISKDYAELLVLIIIFTGIGCVSAGIAYVVYKRRNRYK
ncbi:MAG: hypothetical protein GF383_13430 [Candidatus Lokiarchaeota archaeon]|nr:hypothetical protein [Candidatus Lokiarchaeota archaeon]MBD3342199.1 hypothetical protein [Candidatus Lokiarchaeota archaeon]